MVISNPDAVAAAAATNNTAGEAVDLAHPSGIPRDRIDNIMSGIANTGDVKMNNHRKKLRQRFDIIKKLGQGTYGKVQLGINKETGQEVAIKTIKKCKIEAEADLVRIRREVQIMSSVQHPNIIHIYEVFENREKMVLVMEFAAGGELYDYLSERKVLNEEEARRIFRQVATAVYYCHKHKICHRDLKLENILLDEHGNAKIADFGLSNVFDEQNLLSTFCGSPLYASPEIVEGTPYQGPEVDCWSLGVLLYTLVYGSMPFDGSNFKRLVKQISQGDYYEPKKPSRASTLIRDMLTVSPRKRATIEQICAHWWVNENDNVSCLDLAEELATQTPVRLDVLLSLTPAAVTADQLVVPSADAGKGDRVPRSHSVGSIRDMGGNTEAERRILDMVAAGGEAALMPSPTRTITPTQSPVQSKRKLETTVSTENAHGAALKKKDKLGSSSMVLGESNVPLSQEIPMETEEDEAAEQDIDEELITSAGANKMPSSSFSQRDMEKVGDLCEQLIKDESKSAIAAPLTEVNTSVTPTHGGLPRQKTISKLESLEEAPEEKDATKVIKKFVNKRKTADLVNAIGQITPTAEKINEQSTPTLATTTTSNAKGAIVKPATGAAVANNATPAPFVRKCSLQDEGSLSKFNADRRKSRVLETTEKLQQMNTVNSTGGGSEKPKKFSIPGVSVGSFKKEFERKATNPPVQQGPTPGELRAMEEVAAAAAAAQELEGEVQSPTADSAQQPTGHIEASDSKNSVASLSLEDARRSMENSIALLRQAQSESSKEVDQLCAQTENIEVSEASSPIVIAERERKLKNARAIIGNAIQPASPGGEPNNNVKTSTATITLKSATLPRRKPSAKTEIQLEIKPRIVEQPNMRFTTEMQHPVADLRSAPPREGPAPYSPIKTMLNTRATSLEPKEHIIPIQRPQAPYARTTSNTTTRSGSLSRQSTNDSESDTTTTANMSQSTVTGSSQPIKKSPREFIIPIAMEGGGFITPREGSIEPSESSHTASSRSTFNRLRPTRRIGSSLLNESGIDDSSPFPKFRTSSGTREVDEVPRFTLHRLRSSRPVKKLSQENDSQSSGEEDDDDGFEILTAENLFSTLLQRVHALTHRMNVDKDLTAGFSNSSRLLSNMRHGPFWNQEPFGSRLNSASGNNVGTPWRHSMSRDLGNDMDSIFSRTGATLPRGTMGPTKIGRPTTIAEPSSTVDGQATPAIAADEPLDLADLDLSRLRLSKKDLETLSSITPGLPKCFQEQLLAKLPPTQARKLSRTLSMQGGTQTAPVRVYKRSQSGGRGVLHTGGGQDLKENIAEETASSSTTSKRSTDSSERRHYDPVYRRSLSRTRYDYESSIPSSSDVVSKSRSSSVCRDDYGKSMCSTYTTDINDRYKYYSPYLNKTPTKDSYTESGSASPQKRYSTLGIPRETIGSAQGRPPSGCLSPPIISADSGNSSLRRRSSQKRISRFLRPDFFDEPLDEDPFQREKKQRERETQTVLREIRERSREPSRERGNYTSFDAEDALSRKNSLPNAESSGIPLKTEPKHVRNKSMEIYSEYQPGSSSSQETIRHNRRSLSRPHEMTEELRKNELADKILEELQLLSATRTQQEQQQLRSALPREISVERSSETTTKSVVEGLSNRAEIEEKESSSTIKKIKKIKPKDKSNTTESSTDADATVTTSVVKKVKKIVRKTETTKTTLNEAAAANSSTTEDNILTPAEIEQSRRESKLKRPKSYPTKEPSTLTPKLPNKPSTIPEMTADSTLEASNAQATRESRLIRPKSYPASKLTPPKESRKVTRSGAAIPAIAEGRVRNSTPPLAVEEKFEPHTPTSRGTIETSSSSDNKPTTVKKIVKVSKKSKLAQPLPVTPTTPTPATTITPADNCKESSFVVKEKSPEKKPSKGLLYAIGQKFEKLRDSAMSKEKKSITSSPTSSANGAVVKKKSPESSSPDKVKDKSTLLKKKKSLDGNSQTAGENNTTVKPLGITCEGKEKPAKSDKRSRIDAVIRSLRERSVPRSRPATETNYIKRAVSVENMPGTFNKNAVNRVLGLFKRSDKDVNGAERRVQSTRSTSNIERQIRETSPSPIYQNTGECHRSNSISAAIGTNLSSGRKPEITAKCSCEIASTLTVKAEEKQCVECLQDAVALQKPKSNRDEKDVVLSNKEITQGNKDKRKGLMLDLTKLDKIDNNTTTNRNNIKATYMNGNGIYSNLPPYPGAVNSSSNNSSSQQSMDNVTNNNNSYMTNNNSSMQTSQTSGYRTSSTHEINRNHLLTPSTENIANYSSDSRSYQDDCASTSTFLSPTEEPELYFDNWSVCSEDNYMLHASPSPTVSRLSRASQLSSPTRGESSDPNESVIDRIKRRSFYCRFNDKKPKRTSSIVGPSAVRDYYREQQAAIKARSSNKLNPNERAKSPDITQEFFRPLKLSPVGTELKPPIYKAPFDYATNITKPRKSLNDIRPTTSPSLISKRYGSTADSDYITLNSGVPIRYKPSASSSPYESKVFSATSGLSMGVGTGIGAGTGVGGTYYNTYSPKRRSSYTFNGTLPSGATLTNSTLDGYATVGRRPIRAYDHRTMSLLDPTTSSPSTAGVSSFRREARTPVRDYTSSISRSSSRYRTSSATRSPTNI